MSLRKKLVTHLALPLAFVAAGGLAGLAVFRLAPTPARAETTRPAPVVEIVEARPAPATARVAASGVVVAARQVTVSPEVAGRIVARHPALEPGGRVRAGEVVARLDPREARLALRQEEARAAIAEAEIVSETARGQVAERQWEIFGDGRPAAEAPLAVRRPQLRAARASLEAAESGVERARLNLRRTVVRAPWNAVVTQARAEVGQFVAPGAELATLVGTDRVWVRVAVPAGRLLDLEVPGLGAAADRGSPARVVHDLGGGRRSEWPGEVIRLEGRLEPETRTAQLLVAVDGPFDPPEGVLPLLPGSFVRVEIAGREREGVFELPRAAVRDGGVLWTVDAESTLERREVEVEWGTDDSVFVTGELEGGDRVVTSALSSPIAGAEVRVRRRGDG